MPRDPAAGPAKAQSGLIDLDRLLLAGRRAFQGARAPCSPGRALLACALSVFCVVVVSFFFRFLVFCAGVGRCAMGYQGDENGGGLFMDSGVVRRWVARRILKHFFAKRAPYFSLPRLGHRGSSVREIVGARSRSPSMRLG